MITIVSRSSVKQVRLRSLGSSRRSRTKYYMQQFVMNVTPGCFPRGQRVMAVVAGRFLSKNNRPRGLSFRIRPFTDRLLGSIHSRHIRSRSWNWTLAREYWVGLNRHTTRYPSINVSNSRSERLKLLPLTRWRTKLIGPFMYSFRRNNEFGDFRESPI